MDTPKKVLQAYKQAPWRVQLQWFLMLLGMLVVVVVVASVYLDVSTRAATAGLEIQRLEYSKEETLRKIADLKIKLAHLTSQEVMEARATDLGYEDVDPTTVLYLMVDNYPGRQPVMMAAPPSRRVTNPPLVKPSYTQSLWEFLSQGFLALSETSVGVTQ
jgi:cell division protein FtsL